MQHSLAARSDACAEKRGQRGTTTNDVALSFDDAEQVFDFMRADGSIMHVCLPCMLHSAVVLASTPVF